MRALNTFFPDQRSAAYASAVLHGTGSGARSPSR